MRFHPRVSPAISRIACVSIVAIVGAAVTTANAVKAAELNPAHVPVDAKWLIHADQEALSDLEVIEELRETFPQITSSIREWFRNRYGIDPQDGLGSLTMFSRDYQPHTGTVLLHTEYDHKKIRSILNEYDSLNKTKWKGCTLYTITLARHHDYEQHAACHASKHGAAKHGAEKHGAAVYGENGHSAAADGHDKSGGKQMTVFLGDELIVLASSVPNAKSVLRLLEGDAESLEGIKSPLIAEASEGAVIYGAAIELGRLDRCQMLLPLLQQQERCVYAFGQRDKKLFETLTLTAQSEKVAKKSTEVLEGMIAYEQLCAAGSEPLTKLMNKVELTRNGTESSVTWEGDSALVVEAARDFGERVKQWMRILDIPRWQNGEEQSREVDLAAQERPRERRLVRRAWLGAMIRAAGDVGVEVARIYLDSPADKAGLKAGDRITQIDGEGVSSPQTVVERIRRLEPGTKVEIVVDRDGKELTVDVEIGNLEDFHERLFGERFRRKFDDFHEMFDPDFDGVPERVFAFRIPAGEDDELTLRELLREMREELKQFRQEFQESNGGDRDSSTEHDTEATEES